MTLKAPEVTGAEMSKRMSGTEKKLTRVLLGGNDGSPSTTYIKLKPLSPEQVEKGIYQELKVGDGISGILESTFVDDYKKTNFVLKRASGATIAIAGAGNLTKKMAAVPVGAYVEIIYEGKSPIKNGPFKGTPAHGFDVSYEVV